MNQIEKLGLRWQFESFTPDYQKTIYKEMLRDFAKAWHYKRNRTYIHARIKEFQACRPDLGIETEFKYMVPDFNCDWSMYDSRKEYKEVYIGPDAWRQM